MLVIGGGECRSSSVKGITLDQFLLAYGLPLPYPGQVSDPDVCNEFGRLSA